MSPEAKNRPPGPHPVDGNKTAENLDHVLTPTSGHRQVPRISPGEITAEGIARALGGRQVGRHEWLCHCPAHDDRRPSLSIGEAVDGRPLVYCHAGCEQSAVIEALRAKGLWPARIRTTPAEGKPRVMRFGVRNLAGELIAVHVREDHPGGGKTFFWELPDGSRGLGGVQVAQLPLFGTEQLRDLAPGSLAILTEGEKSALAVQAMGFVALATTTGARGCPHSTVLEVLRPFRVVLWPDNDGPGREHMDRIAEKLAKLGMTPLLLRWPDAPVRGDAADFLEWYGAQAAPKLQELVAQAKPWEPEPDPKPEGETSGLIALAGGEGAHQGSRSAAARVVDLVKRAGVELWREAGSGEAWVTFEVGKHAEHSRVRDRAARAWITRLYFEATGSVLNRNALQDTLGYLEAEAIHNGAEHEVFLRVGEHNGAIYLDLGRDDHLVVQVTGDGWGVIAGEEAPVRFRRGTQQEALPIPEKTGPEALDAFCDLLKLRERRDKALLLAWALGTLTPHGPFPVLILQGERGAGKTLAGRLLTKLLAPQGFGLLSEPKSIDDLMVAAWHRRILALDNLSSIPPWLSDALCRVSTGGVIERRRLYTNDEASTIELARPVLITAISLGAVRDDLGDRSICLTLPRLADGERRPEEEVWARFRELHPAALGALLSALSLGLARKEEVRGQLRELPRLADWGLLVASAAPGLGFEEREVLEAFRSVQSELEGDLLDADPVAGAILNFIEALGTREGVFRAGDLLRELERVAGLADTRVKPPGWPKSPVALAKALPRLQGALRSRGVLVTAKRDPRQHQILWVIGKTPGTSPQSPASPQVFCSHEVSSREFPAEISAPSPAASPASQTVESKRVAGGAGDAGDVPGTFLSSPHAPAQQPSEGEEELPRERQEEAGWFTEAWPIA